MGIFEKLLSLWVALAIAGGVALGMVAPGLFEAVAQMQWARVNLVVAVLIWVMVYPMMLKVDLGSLKHVSKKPRGLVLTVVVNWLIKPFSMAALGILFFKHVFAGLVPPDLAEEYIAGMILLGVAPCTAMVFVWSNLSNGDPNYTLVQVTLNDIILVFAFAPLAGLLMGVTNLTVPWDTLLFSVLIFVVVPLAAGVVTQRAISGARLAALASALKPAAIIGLLLTVLLLFGFQAETISAQPSRVALIAVPLVIQSYGIFIIAYAGAKFLRLPHNVAAPAALIGTSNFFELAVAVAISLFGLSSGAALATVVGVLVEVPVMLSLVAFANRTQRWFPAAPKA